MSATAHPNSRARGSESHDTIPPMTGGQPVLAPPTFQSPPAHGYPVNAAQLPPPLRLYDLNNIPNHTLQGRHEVSPSQDLVARSPTNCRPLGQAVPISALLIDTAPEHAPSRRVDSLGSYDQTPRIVSPGGCKGSPTMQQQMVRRQNYVPITVNGPRTSPRLPAFPPPLGYRFPENIGLASQTTRPNFTPTLGSPLSALQYQHHRQRSSAYSPTSSSSDSQAAFSSEPRSATSERSRTFPSGWDSTDAEIEYKLIVRQQPVAARACGFGERDRRVIDPPPIIELQAHNPLTGETAFVNECTTSLHCGLVDAATGKDCSMIPAPNKDMAGAQRLMGSAMASPWPGKDENGTHATFFVFADLSVRSPGKFILRFRLLQVNPLAASKDGKITASIDSLPFDVFTAKEFPGMRSSSLLLRALRAQGLNVGVKKGSDKVRGKGVKDSDDSGSEESGSDAGVAGPSEKRVKMGKKVSHREVGRSATKGKGTNIRG